VSSAPLDGYRVVDLTSNMAGPFGTQILGDQGADVIKVEPLVGDITRHTGTEANGMSAYFANLNRSKRSVAVDLRRDEGRAVVRDLIATADVFVHSMRLDAAARAGLDAETVRRDRPELVHVAIAGFGTHGPLAGLPVYDHVVQALSGMASIQAERDGSPRLTRHGLVDKATGHVLAESVCAALLRRHRTGEGASLSISMLEVALAFLWPDGMMTESVLAPTVGRPAVAGSFRATPTGDGHLVFVAMTDAQWAGVAAAVVDMGEPAVEGESRVDLLRRLRTCLRATTTAAAVDLLTRHEVPCAPVLGLDEVADHPQVVANGSAPVLDHPVMGPLRQVVPVPSWPGVEVGALRPAPSVGEHTREVLTSIGYDPARLDQLTADGVIG
jgi:crotonobetainyl-CoA:carnitine CoA-transferase CaiB-like acyl-CoA transferase